LSILITLNYGCASYFCKACGGRVGKVTGVLIGKAEYLSYKCLVEKERKKAEVEMWNETKLKTKISGLPKGGMVRYNYSSIIVDYSYEIIVKQNDQIIAREVYKGVAGYYNNGWFGGVVHCYLEKPISTPFTVHIIDKISQNRADIKIIPDAAYSYK